MIVPSETATIGEIFFDAAQRYPDDYDGVPGLHVIRV